MVIPLRPEWNGMTSFHSGRNDHSNQAGMEWVHSILAGMESSFHSGWNGMAIPFRPEWNDSIPFWTEWNELSIPAGMDIPIRPEWNATPSIILRNMRPGNTEYCQKGVNSYLI